MIEPSPSETRIAIIVSPFYYSTHSTARSESVYGHPDRIPDGESMWVTFVGVRQFGTVLAFKPAGTLQLACNVSKTLSSFLLW